MVVYENGIGLAGNPYDDGKPTQPPVSGGGKCFNSIGGTNGTLFRLDGLWEPDCVMFKG
jgi:hypothetical protein